ncbi:uncharacterized protein MELLADRAFT_86839 [Melampsora larici-populina 98AG31]|uniref:DUF4218 domain-containing protein n=1 Tax=Melampsora larici-populina (strain 98AG31 / pathotype 3-4-7) TaxID=747676 RepID=F4R3K8_MELLP|nr:uncharacterized protein MELLADRAFT_86839 [Melampsora larici-populina 98AG31]EGG12644.1 hypothetical protein MELLADRAFT_86839 [Melampsora larici-populina 98AG31]
MKDLENEEEILPPISTVELLNLVAEYSEPLPRNQPSTPQSQRDDEETGTAINDAEFSNHTSSSDNDFEPFNDDGWNGDWHAPPLEEIVFDATVLRHINSILPKIHTPTWIKRPIPVLGKASFGKLKADEWRSLLTLQLPLILIPMWSRQDHIKRSLLRNFIHLVSLINIGLKRVMDSFQIKRYRHHIQKYLESSVLIFQHCKLAPNHHMAIHLADCLERFGPVRAWWSFPFERLMGKILKAGHNNHITELEITFLKQFCRASNLSALIEDDKLPEALEQYSVRLQALYKQPAPRANRPSHSKMSPLSDVVLDLLVAYLNDTEGERCIWIRPDKWASLSKSDSLAYAPVPAQGQFYKRINYNDGFVSTFTDNPDNSCIYFKNTDGRDSFGRVFSIFSHLRAAVKSESISDVWLHCALRMWSPTENKVIKLKEVIAQCTWIMYKAGEMNKDVEVPTIGMIILKR